tara:strand:+ start:267 stop:491 length:225 start_codon:yes stop_codon:yes gene_type:complete
MKIIIDDYFSHVSIHYNGIEYWIDFNSTLQGYWYFYECTKSALDDDLLRGRNTIKTDKSLVLKRCIDKLLEGEN